MLNSFIFQICSLFFIILISIIYFFKKKIKTIENQVFKYLLLFNFILLISDIVSVYFIYHMKQYPFLNLFFGKLYLMILILWEVTLLIYVFVISENKNGEKNLDRYPLLLSGIIWIISCILIMILPLNFVSESNFVYSYGPAALFTYCLTAFVMLIWIIRLFSRLSIIKKQKYTPLLLYIGMMICGALVQFFEPSLLVVSFVISYVTCIIYFTIENPDVKMIEQLNIAKDIADKANNAKTEFLSSMSHEVRTPLNAIMGFSESLKEENLSEKAQEEVNDIISASNSLLEIVNGILDISKIEANKLEIVDNEYDVYKMINDLKNLTKARIGTKDVELKVNIDQTLPQVLYGDEIRLKQIILNLLTNAAKYTDKGQIEFNINCVFNQDICRLIISVKDTGRGIKEENINKLFTKFERLDEKNSTIEGTGLGLAITKKLVDLMQGKIVVQSKANVGSNFMVSIDQKIVANPTLKIEKETIIKETTNNYKDKKILIVDDNLLNLKVAVRLLEPYEMNIEEADNGDDAINKVKQNLNYDLILLDDMMPHKSGGETLEELKQIPNFNIPVVVLTANAIEGMKEKYLEMGFDDYLAKPIIKDELKRVLQKYLNK